MKKVKRIIAILISLCRQVFEVEPDNYAFRAFVKPFACRLERLLKTRWGHVLSYGNYKSNNRSGYGEVYFSAKENLSE